MKMLAVIVLLLFVSCSARAAFKVPPAPQLHSVLDARAPVQQAVFFAPDSPPQAPPHNYLPGFPRTMAGCGLIGASTICFIVGNIQANASPSITAGLGAALLGIIFFLTGLTLALSGLGTRYRYKSKSK